MKLILIFLTVFLVYSCNYNKLNVAKRNKLVEKYDLINFHKHDKPVFVSLQEFFDGNNDFGSIAPNFSSRKSNSEFYKILNKIQKSPKVKKISVRICDINIYENKKLDDNEWPYSEYIYFATTMSKEELTIQTSNLKPDAIEYELNPIFLNQFDIKNNEHLIYIWWD